MKEEIDISVIIPVFNNEGSLSRAVEMFVNTVFVEFSNKSFELILVDDGSKDYSWDKMLDVKKQYPGLIKLIRFTRNFGQVAAIYAGYESARGEGILNASADCQENSSLFTELIKSFNSDKAIIQAGQRIERDESAYRKLTSRFFYTLMQKLGFSNMPVGGFDILLINKDVKDSLLGLNHTNPFWQGQILWLGYPIKFTPYHRLERHSGKSGWTFSKKYKYFLDGVLNNSYLPLRIFFYLGLISFILGCVYVSILLISYFNGGAPFKGWTPVMISIWIFSGLQMMLCGIIGEYLWRTFEQVKQNPLYIKSEEQS